MRAERRHRWAVVYAAGSTVAALVVQDGFSGDPWLLRVVLTATAFCAAFLLWELALLLTGRWLHPDDEDRRG